MAWSMCLMYPLPGLPLRPGPSGRRRLLASLVDPAFSVFPPTLSGSRLPFPQFPLAMPAFPHEIVEAPGFRSFPLQAFLLQTQPFALQPRGLFAGQMRLACSFILLPLPLVIPPGVRIIIRILVIRTLRSAAFTEQQDCEKRSAYFCPRQCQCSVRHITASYQSSPGDPERRCRAGPAPEHARRPEDQLRQRPGR